MSTELEKLKTELETLRADNDWYAKTLPQICDQRNSYHVEMEKALGDLSRVIKAVRFVHAEYEGRCVTCEERCDCLDLDDMALVGDCTHGNAEWPCTTIQQLDAAITPAQVQP